MRTYAYEHTFYKQRLLIMGTGEVVAQLAFDC